MPPDPQGNARLLAKINFPISGKRGFFLLLANTLHLLHHSAYIVKPSFVTNPSINEFLAISDPCSKKTRLG
jgi:hypothetical protein